jgi:hypothetical protein
MTVDDHRISNDQALRPNAAGRCLRGLSKHRDRHQQRGEANADRHVSGDEVRAISSVARYADARDQTRLRLTAVHCLFRNDSIRGPSVKRSVARPTLTVLILLSTSVDAQISSRKPTIAAPPTRSVPSATLPMATCPVGSDTTYDARIMLPSTLRGARSVVVTICLGRGRRLAGITGFDATLTFPSTLATYDSASSPLAVNRVVDATGPGIVHFSASLSSAVPSGPILAVRLHLSRPGFIPPLGLSFSRLTTTKGTSALDRLWIQGRAPVRIEARRPGSNIRVSRAIVDSTPRLISLDRQTIPLSRLAAGEVVTLTILGDYFDRTSNVVTFGPMSIPNVPSRNGTSITIGIPASYEAAGGAPPISLGAGVYQITVTTSHGRSNALQFRIMP